jgi:N utilization substance protein A
MVLSRIHPDLVKYLVTRQTPELEDRKIEIKDIAREPGVRTKIAVLSHDSRLDASGACIGQRGSRVKNVMDELNGEKVDIVNWSDDPRQMIRNALSPAQVETIEFDIERHSARAIVKDDQMSLAIGKRGLNVKLSSRLTGWDLKVMTETDWIAWKEKGSKEIDSLPDLDEAERNALRMAGMDCFYAIVQAGVYKVQTTLDISQEKAESLYAFSSEGQHKREEADALEAAKKYEDARIKRQPVLAPEQTTQDPSEQHK